MKSKIKRIKQADSLKYGDIFIFKDKSTGKLPSECLSFKYGIQAGVPLIFIKKYRDEFMYASLSGQHTRNKKALKYCELAEILPKFLEEMEK